MTLLIDKLRKFTKDEGEFNTITHNIFTKTETKKNKIVDRLTKKLNRLTDTRDCDCYIVSQNDETDSENAKPKQTNAILSAYDQTRPNSNAVKHAKKKRKQKSKHTKRPVTSPKSQKQQPEEMASNQSKKRGSPKQHQVELHQSCEMGQPRQANQSNKQVQQQTGMQKHLTSVIQQLVGCLKALSGTGGSSVSHAENNGRNKRRSKKKYRGVKNGFKSI